MKTAPRPLIRSVPIWTTAALAGLLALGSIRFGREVPPLQDVPRWFRESVESRRWEERQRLEMQRGRIEAAGDIAAGRVRVRSGWRSNSLYATLVRRRYGIEVVQAPMCALGDIEYPYWAGYQEVSRPFLLKQFGTYRFEDCQAEAERAEAELTRDCFERQHHRQPGA